jgi:hypothetical protein
VYSSFIQTPRCLGRFATDNSASDFHGITTNAAFRPALAAWLVGWMMTGAPSVAVSVALLLLSEPKTFVTMHRNCIPFMNEFAWTVNIRERVPDQYGA